MSNRKQCRFEGCIKPAYSRELCNTHYQQWYRGAELTPLRQRKPDVVGLGTDAGYVLAMLPDEFLKLCVAEAKRREMKNAS